MFVQTIDDEDISTPPPAKKLKKSQCTPLFMCAYRMRGKIYTGLTVFFCTYYIVYIMYIDLESSKSRDFYDIKQLTTTLLLIKNADSNTFMDDVSGLKSPK